MRIPLNHLVTQGEDTIYCQRSSFCGVALVIVFSSAGMVTDNTVGYQLPTGSSHGTYKQKADGMSHLHFQKIRTKVFQNCSCQGSKDATDKEFDFPFVVRLKISPPNIEYNRALVNDQCKNFETFAEALLVSALHNHFSAAEVLFAMPNTKVLYA